MIWRLLAGSAPAWASLARAALSVERPLRSKYWLAIWRLSSRTDQLPRRASVS